MLSPTRPPVPRLRKLLEWSRGLPLTYPDVGATAGPPPAGYTRDHHRVRLGDGAEAFGGACAALRDWAMFDLGWVGVWRPDRQTEEGTVVAVVAHGFAIWAAFPCRIVRVWETHREVESLGFAHGTLPGHVLAGEERFEVSWDRRDGSVWYDVLAYSRPAGWLGRAAYRLVRPVQRRFGPDSCRAMARATGGAVR